MCHKDGGAACVGWRGDDPKSARCEVYALSVGSGISTHPWCISFTYLLPLGTFSQKLSSPYSSTPAGAGTRMRRPPHDPRTRLRGAGVIVHTFSKQKAHACTMEGFRKFPHFNSSLFFARRRVFIIALHSRNPSPRKHTVQHRNATIRRPPPLPPPSRRYRNRFSFIVFLFITSLPSIVITIFLLLPSTAAFAFRPPRLLALRLLLLRPSHHILGGSTPRLPPRMSSSSSSPPPPPLVSPPSPPTLPPNPLHLPHKPDHYQGIIIETEQLPTDPAVFDTQLRASLSGRCMRV